jgi:hypothetical protein
VISHKRVKKKKFPPQSPIDFFKEIQKRNSSKFYRPHPTGEWKTQGFPTEPYWKILFIKKKKKKREKAWYVHNLK